MKRHPTLVLRRQGAVLPTVVAVVAAAALAACTSAVDQQPSATNAAPQRGGTLSVAVTPDAQPGAVLGGYNSNWPYVYNVFEPLLRLDPESRKPAAVLATKWTVAADGLSMDLTLRDDVTFHTGRKMTADDVKFSFEKAADPATASQVGFIARQFTAIKVTSPTAVTIDFKNPLSNIWDFLDMTSIVDKETYAGLADGSKVVGTGPYEFVKWRPGAEYRLERYKNYRDKDVAYLDSIQFDVMNSSTAELSAIRSGRDQIAFGLSTTDVQGFASDDRYTIVDAGGSIYPFGMDVTVAPFDKKEVRQAMHYAIDRERINKQVFQGTGTITDLFWGPKFPEYPKKLAGEYTYDPAKAKKMIEDAGAAGTPVPIVYMTTPIQDNVFEIVANNLAAVGLKPKGVPLDSPTFIARQIKGDLGPVFLGTHGQVGRGASTLLDSLPTLRKGNPSKYWSSEYEGLRKAVLAASTEQESADALEALSSHMLDEAFVMPILQAPTQIVIDSRKVQGVQLAATGGLLFHKAYVEN